MGWELGALWVVDGVENVLRHTRYWTTDQAGTADFVDMSRLLAFERGLGLPGRAWAQTSVVWIPDVGTDPLFSRGPLAAETGFRSALAFPVIVAGQVISVMEFLSRDIREPDAALRDMVESLSVQISRFLERARAIVELRESENRNRAVLETALDAMIQMDHMGIIREFNPAAVEMFGYERGQAVGQELASLIIPPSLRKHHREGLAHFIATGEGPLIGKRIETTALRADRVIFPIELSIAAVLAGGPPTFNGFVRDITARRHAEEQARFLINAGELLADSLDYEQTLAHVAQLAVPYFADWCIVDLVDGAGLVQRIAVAHAQPALEPLLREMTARYPPVPGQAHPANVAVQTGQPLLIENVDETIWEQIAHDDEHLRMLEELHPRSGLTAPLIARGRVIGAIEFVRAETARRFKHADVALGEEVARRAAVAVDNARLYQATQDALREREESLALLETVLATAPVGIVFFDREKRFVRINDVLAEVNGLSTSQHIGRTLAETVPNLAATLEPILDRILDTGEPVLDFEIDAETVGIPGEPRHWLASYYPVKGLSGEVFGVGGVVTEITARHQAEERLRFLAGASHILSASLDYEHTLTSIAKLAVPFLADWCVVYLVDDDGAIRRLATEHSNPEHAAVSKAMHQHVTLNPHAETGVPHVIRTGAAILMPEVTPADLAADADDPSLLTEMTQALQLTSWMCVPLSVHGDGIGAISFITGEGGRVYTQSDLDMAEVIGRRAAVAVDNARLFRAEQQTRKYAERVAEQTNRLQAVTAALSRSLTSSEVAEVIVDLGVATLEAQRAMLVVLAEGGENMEIVRAVGYPAEFGNNWRSYPLDVSTPPTDALRSGTPIFLESFADRAARYPHLARERSLIGGGAVAAIPLTIGDRALGAMTLGFENSRHFDAGDRAFLMALAQQCAQALERARLYEVEQENRAAAERAREQAAQQAHRQRLLSEASRSFAEASLDMTQVVDSVARRVAQMLDGFAGVYLIDEDEPVAIATAATCHVDGGRQDATAEVIAHALQAREGSSLRVALTAQTTLTWDVTVPDIRARVFAIEDWATVDGLGLHSIMATQLRMRSEAIGMLVVARHETAPPYTRDDQDLLGDLASRASLAIENARLYLQAQSAIQVREQFLSIASHELRTPLTTVKASAQLLGRRFRRGDTNPDRTMHLIDQLQGEVGRLETLVEDLLDATQIQRGRLELNPERFDLTELARHCLDRFDQPLHRTEKHVLTFTAREAIVGTWDASRLDQVITNLISNALKYSPDGGVVGVTVRRVADEVEIAVSDEGIGISQEEQQQLFRPFARGAEARRSVGGTGLGLFISGQIVERHGGRITIESEPGAGSTFTVRLPIEPPVSVTPGDGERD